MKRILISLFIFAVSSIFGQKIAVMDFIPKGDFKQDEIDILSERFRTEIVKTKKFEVMERKALEVLNKELALQMSDEFSDRMVAEYGEKIGAEIVVTGYLGRLRNLYTIDVKMVNVQSGKIIDSWEADHQGDFEEIPKILRGIALKMAGIEEEKSRTWFWIGGSAVLIGAGAAFYLTSQEKPAVETGLKPPPDMPDVP